MSTLCVNGGGARNLCERLTYSSGFTRFRLSGSLSVTGGLVMKRGMRRWFFDAEWGCIDISHQPLFADQREFLP